MRAVEMLAARILFLGGVTAVLVMALGMAGFLWSHGVAATSERATPGASAHLIYTSVPDVARALAHWPAEPLAIVAAGVLLLLATPVTAVVVVFSVFAGTGDRRYATISALLILALLVSLMFVGR
jgi:uncharacterized membrane protein